MKSKIKIPPLKTYIAIAMLFLLIHADVKARHSYRTIMEGTIPDQLKGKAPVARLARYEVKPEYQTAFRKAVSDYVLFSLEQRGNILSEAYYETDNTSVWWLIERWSSRDELEKNSRSLPFGTLASSAKTALAQPEKIIEVKDLEPLSKQQWRNKAKENDDPLTIMLFVDTKPGTDGTFKDVYHTAMPQFRSEPGVITYQLSQLEADNTQFVTYEKFRDEDAFQYHLKFPPIQPVIDYLQTSIKKQPFQSGLHRLKAFVPLDQK